MSKLNDYYVDIEDDESSGSDNDLHTHWKLFRIIFFYLQ